MKFSVENCFKIRQIIMRKSTVVVAPALAWYSIRVQLSVCLYILSFAGGWGSIALVGHSSRSLLDLYTKLAGQGKLIVLVDSSPRSF